jgi:MFS family permease
VLQAAAFILLGISHALPFIYVSAFLFALTAWSIPALMAALAGDAFGPRLAPAALGLMTIVFGTGQALGPWCAGVLADATNSFSIAFVIAGAAALIVGAGGALLIRPAKG